MALTVLCVPYSLEIGGGRMKRGAKSRARGEGSRTRGGRPRENSASITDRDQHGHLYSLGEGRGASVTASTLLVMQNTYFGSVRVKLGAS